MDKDTDYSLLQTKYDKIASQHKSDLNSMTKQISGLQDTVRILKADNLTQSQDKKQRILLEKKVTEYSKLITELTDYRHKYQDAEKSRNKYKLMYQEITIKCEQLSDIEKKYDAVSKQYKEFKSSNHNLQTIVNNKKSENERLQQINNKLQNNITLFEKAIEKMKLELQNKENVEQELSNKIHSLQESFKTEKSEFLIRLSKNDEQYKKLETDLAFKTGKLSNIEENGEKLIKLNNDFNNLLQQFTKSKQINNELREMKSDVEQKLSDMQQKNTELQNKFNTLRTENVDLNRTIEKAHKSIERNTLTYKATINNLNIQLDDLHVKYKDAADKVVDIRQKISRIQELEQQNQKLTLTIENINQTNTELTNALNTLVKEYNKLSKEYNMNKLQQIQVDDLIQKHKSLAQERDELIKELKLLKSDSSKELREKNETYKQRISKLEEKVINITKECDTHRRKCRDLEYDATILTEYKDKIVKLELTTKNVLIRNKDLTKRIDELPTPFELQKNEQLRNALSTENANLKKRLSNLHAQIRTLDRLKENDKQQSVLLNDRHLQILALTKEINNLKEQIKKYQETQQVLRDEMTKIQDNLHPLESTVTEQKQEIEKLKKAPALLNVKVKRLRDDSMGTIHKYINAEKKVRKELIDSKVRNKELQHAIEMLTNEIDQSNADIEHLVNMKDELKSNFLRNLNDQKSSGELQISELQKLIDLRDARIKELEELLNTFVKKQLLGVTPTES
jgi:chromosome segregation ATPase